MGTKINPSDYDCYAKAGPDEEMFVLLARDAIAPMLVRQWAHQRSMQISTGAKPETDYPMVKEALACADKMEKWRHENIEMPNNDAAIVTAEAEARGTRSYTDRPTKPQNQPPPKAPKA